MAVVLEGEAKVGLRARLSDEGDVGLVRCLVFNKLERLARVKVSRRSSLES